MKKVFLSIWQWLFGMRKGVEITAPLQKPTMNVVKEEPKEDMVEAILNGNAPKPKFMDVKESSDMLTDATLNKINHLTSKSERVMPLDNENIEEQLQEKGSYEPLKFLIIKDGQKYWLTEKQFVFYTTIENGGKVRGVDICKAFLEFKNPTGIPQNLPHWKYSMSSHKSTMAYLFKSGLIKKTGKFYSIK